MIKWYGLSPSEYNNRYYYPALTYKSAYENYEDSEISGDELL